MLGAVESSAAADHIVFGELSGGYFLSAAFAAHEELPVRGAD